MHLQTIRKIAKQHGLETKSLGKVELVRGIQKGEGNFDCFAKAYEGYCDRNDCLWREDCLTLSTKQQLAG